MSDPAVATSRPAASSSAIEREVRRHRIMGRVLLGWSYESIAEAEDLRPARVRQIVGQTLALREIDPAGAHARLQTTRLDASLRLAAEKVEDGDLAGIERLLRVLDRLDRYRNAAAAPAPLDEEEESTAEFDAGFDDLLRRAAEDKARAAAARAAPDGGAPQSPAPASFCLQPSDLPGSAQK
jgi:hypothetical protein